MKTSISPLWIVLATLTLSGCVVIEKKTMVMVVPPKSNEIHLYYVFEGISVLEHNSSTLARAKNDLDALKEDDFSFFVPGTGKNSPLLEQCRFEKLRFFDDAKRKRPLCADRRLTIRNRDEFAKILNKSISESLMESFLGRDEKEIKGEITKARGELKKEDTRTSANELGMGPLIRTAEGLVELADGFDLASIKQLKAAAQDGFRWVRFEPDAVRLVLPATADCAKRIAADPKATAWLKDMRSFVEPIDLETCPGGLAIVLGKKGQAIRLTYIDTRPHRRSDEAALVEYAGSPKAIMLNAKAASADMLIEQFIAETMKKR